MGDPRPARRGDGHKTIVKQYSTHGPILDQPVAGLLRDLKDRGLLADTLVAFVTEFGRMPTFQKGANGRDHNPSGFTVWLAGAGVKRAFHHGATDDIGYKAVQHVEPMRECPVRPCPCRPTCSKPRTPWLASPAGS